MSVIINDTGFHADIWAGPVTAWNADIATPDKTMSGTALDVPNTLNADELVAYFDQATMIRIPFPSFADGRGFTLARCLRLRGYTGHLRAQGHILADQYAMARRCGFDDVEISDDLAARQPQDQWQFRADWQANDYQTKLRGTAA